MADIIGKGTYGCVTKPSLPCKDGKEKALSKIMNKIDAKDELKEMRNLVNIPGIQKYILQLPTMCTPELSKHFKDTVNNCTSKRVLETKNLRDLRLLLIEDGGVDLQKFSTEIAPTLNKKSMAIFLSSVVHLIEGVDFFKKKNIMHSDIKEHNIVYNVETASIKYIDFGLVRKKTDFIYTSIQNENEGAKSHATYPHENSCAMKLYFETSPKCRLYRNYYNYNFDKFINAAADTFDSFCLTDSLRIVLSNISIHHNSGFPIDLFQELILLLEPYAHSQVFYRKHDLQILRREYIEVLKKYSAYTQSHNPKPSQETRTTASIFSFLNTFNTKTTSPTFAFEKNPEGKRTRQNIIKNSSNPKTKKKRPNPKSSNRRRTSNSGFSINL